MTEESKAEELIEKFYNNIPLTGFEGTYSTFRTLARKSAILAVEEIIKVASDDHVTLGRGPDYPTDKEYWQKVKEILNHKER